MRAYLRQMPFVAVLGLAACQSGSDRDRYPVFFAPRSVKLSSTADAVIARAASDAIKEHARKVAVIGHAEAGRNLSADELLAMKRAANVAEALARQGVDGRIIQQKSRAPRNARNAVVASRTVTIEIDP